MKLLHSHGLQDIKEYDWELPPMEDDQIEIETIMTGVCRSDIGVFSGAETPMPLGKFGHEGLGRVVNVGPTVQKLVGPANVKEGDIVATFSDPAYADRYYARLGEYVPVPEAHPKFILQPTACALNILYNTINTAMGLGIRKTPILILGTGYLSIVIARLSKRMNIPSIEVVGRSNKDKFEGMVKRYDTLEDVKSKYKIIIDLSSKASNFDNSISFLEDEGVLCYAATPSTPVTTNFFDACWKALHIILPSPRSRTFITAMFDCAMMIKNNQLMVDDLWSQGYDRKTEYQQAFQDGLNRPEGYIRGYIKWQ